MRTQPATWATFGTLLLGVLVGVRALAGPLPPPGEAGWREVSFPAVDKRTRYFADATDRSVRAESRCSASALAYSLENVDLEATPVLSWEWKVERSPEVASHHEKAGDDFAARVYVIFAFESERASRWERLKRRAVRALYGVEPPGNALNYVWTANEPAGTRWKSPYTEASRLISRGNPRGWHRERVDVLQDYFDVFGEAPAAPVGVALMSDSDDSCQAATAYFRRFSFSARDRER